MDVDDVIGVFCFIALFCFVGLGALFLFGDFRHFDSVRKSCEERGYVQDYKTRINCQVEKNNVHKQ